MPIRFFSEDIDFKLSQPRIITKWIKLVASREKAVISDLNYIFCSDSYLLSLNQDFLHHNTLTDIITFDYSSSKQSLEGEIYISIERVHENAVKFDRDPGEELHRVIVHGVLHLAGYKDKKKDEKALMRKKEESYLSLLKEVSRGTKKK